MLKRLPIVTVFEDTAHVAAEFTFDTDETVHVEERVYAEGNVKRNLDVVLKPCGGTILTVKDVVAEIVDVVTVIVGVGRVPAVGV